MCAVANSIYYTPLVMVPNCNLTKVIDYVNQKPNQHSGDASFLTQLHCGMLYKITPHMHADIKERVY